MRKKSNVDQLDQSNGSSQITRGDAFLQTAHQNGTGISEVILPLFQFVEGSQRRTRIFVFPCLPGARCVQQCPPSVKPGFCCGKELINTSALCSCCSTHRLPPDCCWLWCFMTQIQLSLVRGCLSLHKVVLRAQPESGNIP